MHIEKFLDENASPGMYSRNELGDLIATALAQDRKECSDKSFDDIEKEYPLSCENGEDARYNWPDRWKAARKCGDVVMRLVRLKCKAERSIAKSLQTWEWCGDGLHVFRSEKPRTILTAIEAAEKE
jgi:hypothetical protein